MGVRVVSENTSLDTRDASDEADYVRVRTFSAPDDEAVTLATIERHVDKTNGTGAWRVKTLVLEQPMSVDHALGLATRYAERKHIPVVYAEKD